MDEESGPETRQEPVATIDETMPYEDFHRLRCPACEVSWTVDTVIAALHPDTCDEPAPTDCWMCGAPGLVDGTLIVPEQRGTPSRRRDTEPA